MKTFKSALFHPLPELRKSPAGKIHIEISAFKIYDKKSNTILLFKFLHKPDLMRVDIGQGKTLAGTFFGIKTNRDPLHYPYVIHRTFLVKISQRDMSGGLIDTDWLNRCWHFLDQRQFLVPVFFIGQIDHFLQK